MTERFRTNLELTHLSATKGRLFCVLHSPANSVDTQGAFLFVPPFAEEMNKARRMVSMQARSLAARGWHVMVVDLYGCGDSEGDLADATWDIWLSDLQVCQRWLAEKVGCRVDLWALRVGALLGLDAIDQSDWRPDQVLLWQPVLHGNSALKALMRQRIVAEIGKDGISKVTTKDLRERLEAGETLELSGYPINSSLAAAIQNASLQNIQISEIDIGWIDIVKAKSGTALDAGSRLRRFWTEAGKKVTFRQVVGDPFWTAGEILESPELIQTTNSLICTNH